MFFHSLALRRTTNVRTDHRNRKWSGHENGASKGGLQTVQGAPRTWWQPCWVGWDKPGAPRAVFMKRADAVHGVVVLVGWGRERLQVGQSGEWRRDDDGVAFGGGFVLALYLINQGYLRFRVLDAELRVIHEVVYGAAGLGRLKTFVRRHAVSESIDHTNLKDKGTQFEV